jgi:hypothetical protein
LTGYGGYEYSYSPVGKSQEKYNIFQSALLKIFENRFWMNTRDHTDFIWRKMEMEGFRIQKRTADNLKLELKKMKKDIAYCSRKNKGEEVSWYIHRSKWPKPKEVNWKAYIVEILKAKGAIPLNFDGWNIEEEMNVPWRLLDFIKEYTEYPSFERAVRDIPIVEIFYCDGPLEQSRGIRLKQTPFNPITEIWSQLLIQKRRTKEETNKFLNEKDLAEVQINTPLAKTSQSEIGVATDEKLNPIVEKAVRMVKKAQKNDIHTISEDQLNSFLKKKGLTEKEIDFVFTETSQTDVQMTAYSTPNPEEIEFKFKGKYNTFWTPPEESLSDTNSLFADNNYQENSVIDDLSYQNSPAKNYQI